MICLYLNSCMFRGYVQSFNTTVQVVDVSDKPIKGRMVKLYIGLSSYDRGSNKQPNNTLKTDENGNATFSYGLSISDSHSDFATFFTDDDATWKVVSYPNHSVSAKKKKSQTLKIVMDTMIPIKVRLQKTSASLLRLSVHSGSYSNASDVNYNDHYARNADVNTVFLNWHRDNVGVFDTLLTFPVFSKANCSILTGTDTIGGISRLGPSIELKRGQRRDTLFNLMVQ